MILVQNVVKPQANVLASMSSPTSGRVRKELLTDAPAYHAATSGFTMAA